MSVTVVLVRMPRRLVVVLLTFIAAVIAYTDRVNISVAAVAMREHFGWSQTEKGLILAAFFLGYLAFMFFAGLLSKRFGGKQVIGWSVLSWSIFTLLTPLAATISVPVLIAARIAMGVGEAGMYPGAYDLFGRWAPPRERGRAMALLNSSAALGTLIGLMGSAWLVQRYGWPTPFYIFGAIGLLWLFLWVRQVENDPATDPYLGHEERALLQTVRPTTEPVREIPLRRLLLRRSVLGIIAGHFAYTWNFYVLLSWLPSYFRDVHAVSIANSGLFSAVPWLVLFAFANVSASVADWVIRQGLSLTATRKLMQCGALLISGALLMALHQVHTSATALILLCTAAGTLAFCSAGHIPIYLDHAPRDSAVLFAFGNMFAALPGVIGVAMTGWLVDVTGTYSAAFVLTAGVSVVGALAFGLLASARPMA